MPLEKTLLTVQRMSQDLPPKNRFYENDSTDAELDLYRLIVTTQFVGYISHMKWEGPNLQGGMTLSLELQGAFPLGGSV